MMDPCCNDIGPFGDRTRDLLHIVYTFDVALRIGHITIGGVTVQADEVRAAAGLDDVGHKIVELVSFCETCVCRS